MPGCQTSVWKWQPLTDDKYDANDRWLTCAVIICNTLISSYPIQSYLISSHLTVSYLILSYLIFKILCMYCSCTILYFSKFASRTVWCGRASAWPQLGYLYNNLHSSPNAWSFRLIVLVTINMLITVCLGIPSSRLWRMEFIGLGGSWRLSGRLCRVLGRLGCVLRRLGAPREASRARLGVSWWCLGGVSGAPLVHPGAYWRVLEHPSA